MPVWIIILSVLFLVLAIFRLDLALLLLIAALPSYLIRFQLAGLPFTFLEVMILISFIVWFGKFFVPNLKNLWKNRPSRIPYPFSWEIALAVIIAFVSVGVAGFSTEALGIWKAYFFEPALLFILLFNIFKTKREWLKIFWALLLSAVVVSLFALVQKITGNFIANPFWAAEAQRRTVSFFGYPNAVGLYLAPIIALLTGWLFYKKEKNSLLKTALILTSIILAVLAVWFARSEGALIGLAAALLVFGLLANKISRLTTIVILIFGAVIIFSSPVLKTVLLEKVALRDLSGEIRRQQWRETGQMLNGSRFWLGAGLSNYQAAVSPYHQEGIFFNRDKIENFHAQAWVNAELREKYWQPVEIYLYPHNIILNFWSELGLAGALLFLWIIIKHLYISLRLTVAYGRDKRSEKYLALGLLMAMVTIVVHGLVDVPYFKNDLAAMFWLLIAFAGAWHLDYRRDQELKN
jgi:O-antigen ligase